jgi:hypothetical protein
MSIEDLGKIKKMQENNEKYHLKMLIDQERK